MDTKSANRFEVHSHSMYSNLRLIDSINRPKDLIQKAYELGLSGIALTDHEFVGNAVDWLNSEKELKEKGIISEDFVCALGNEIYLVEDPACANKWYHLVLIALDTEGYRALSKLSSYAWFGMRSVKGLERVGTSYENFKQIIGEAKGHVVCSSACLGSEVAFRILRIVELEEEGDSEQAYYVKLDLINFIKMCQEVVGEDNYYIEMAPSKSKDQIKYNKKAKEVAAALGVKVVLGGDAHYLTSNDREVHKAFLNSKDGDREVDDFYYYAHLMDNEEAYENLKDIFTPEEFCEVCENSMEILRKIKPYDIFRKPIIPMVDVQIYPQAYDNTLNAYPTLQELKASDDEQERYWFNECVNSLIKMNKWDKAHLERLEEEADIIKTVGKKLETNVFCYFNTFKHYINLFWDCGSMVGAGRGSSVCYLSNYLLGITQIDPLDWGLPAFRFLNKERLELP